MDDNCLYCHLAVQEEDEAIECERCGGWQHRLCHTGISRGRYERANRGAAAITWRCQDCVNDSSSEEEGEGEAPPDLIVEVAAPVAAILDPEEPDMEDVEAEEAEVDQADEMPEETFEVVEGGSQRGAVKLVSSHGFTFCRIRSTQTATYWTCSVRNRTQTCYARVVQKNDEFTRNQVEHIHPPQASCLQKVTVVAQAKRVATQKENLFAPASSIVNQIYLNHNGQVELPSRQHVKRIVNRERAKERPADPVNLEFELDLDYLENDNFFKGDVRVGAERHLIFATPLQVRLLKRSRTWYVDGTFKVVKEPFAQLFSLHAFLRQGDQIRQVPLMFIVMSRRRKKDYKAVFRTIRHDILEDDMAVEYVVADYESAVWKAVAARLPNVEMKGCAFHWAQSVWRKAQEVGLQAQYRMGRGGAYRMLRRIFALQFLPAPHIPRALDGIRRRNTSDMVEQVCAYVEENWLNNETWPAETWSVYRRSVRTNNDVEGWHAKLNRMAQKNKLPFFLLVQLLEKEAQLVSIEHREVMADQLVRHQSAKTRRIQGRIFAAWDVFDNTGNVDTLLKSCGRIYLNNVIR